MGVKPFEMIQWLQALGGTKGDLCAHVLAFQLSQADTLNLNLFQPQRAEKFKHTSRAFPGPFEGFWSSGINIWTQDLQLGSANIGGIFNTQRP